MTRAKLLEQLGKKSITKIKKKDLLSVYQTEGYTMDGPVYEPILTMVIYELQRRENRKSNTIMIICTITITIMTAVILWATLIGANIIACGS